jgi:hypothetical protein
MNRIFTVLIGLCLLPLLGTAQTTYIDEDFSTVTVADSVVPPAGWTNVTVVGDTNLDKFRFDNPGARILNAPITTPAAIFDSDELSNNGSLAEDVVLTSPTFDASMATVVNLEFDHYFQAGFGGAYFVESWNGTSWDTVLSGGAVNTMNPQAENIDISASAAGNANAQVRFRWNGNYSWYWILDNVLVSSPAGDDLGVVSVDQPGVGCGLGATETVSVTVQNYGSAPQNTFSVSFAADGGAAVTEAYTGPAIAAGGTGTYTFTGTADLSAPGPHTIVAWTTLMGDGDNSNDTTTASIDNLSIAITPSFTENFDSYSNGTTIFPEFTNDPNADVDFQVWSGGTSSTFTGPTDDVSGGGKYIYTEASGGSNPKRSRLVSGCIDLAGTTSPQLIFARHLYGGDIDSFEVDVLHSGGTTNILNIIGDELLTNSDPFITDTFDLSAYAGQSIQISFSGYTSNFDGDIALDEIVIKEIVPLDVAVIGVEVPAPGCNLGAAEQITISVLNQGSSAATPVLGGFGVNGVPVTTIPETVAATLAPGDTATYTFTTTADFSAVGVYAVTGAATVVGDADPSNDSLTVITEHLTPSIIPAYTENFDSYANGTTIFPEFTNDPSADVPFQVNSGTTSSTSTGPTDDVSGGGKYIYTETSGTGAGTTSRLLSDCIDLSATTAPQLIFSRHLYGSDIDSFEVDVLHAGGTTNILKIIGEELSANADPFITDTFDLTAYAGQSVQIAFSGYTDDFNGDIALDEIIIKEFVALDVEAVALDLPADGCGLSATAPVTITAINVGTDTVPSILAGFGVNGVVVTTIPEVITGPFAPGDTAVYTFNATADLSVVGPYVVTAVATTLGDGQNSNDTINGTVIHVPTISSFPYQEDFSTGPNGWLAGGTASSWAFGTPAKTTIMGAASDSNAWVTGGLGTGSYNVNENSQVTSPCFDMTNAPVNAWVAMSIWWNAEFSWDGAVLQATTDGGVSWFNIGQEDDPFNWYNDGTIAGSPGGQLIGWTGRASTGNGSGGWVQAKHPLDTAVIGKPDVQFRVAFGSDVSVVDDGFAFDDFTIAAAPTVDLGPDSTALCIGENLSVPADSTVTFDWSTGDSTNFITIQNMTGMDTTQKIWLTATNAFGISASDTIYVTVPASVPTLTAMQDSAVSCFGGSNGGATAMGSGGAGMLMYSWSNGAMTQTVSGLMAGSYDVTVTDTVGCTADASVTITEPMEITVALDSLMDAACAGDSTGAIMISVSGGTAGYTYSWSNGDTTQDLSGIPAGDYTGVITDANGCVLTSPILNVGQPDSLSLALDAPPTDVQCPDDSNGEIAITVTGGTAPYAFSWSNGDTTEDLTGLPVGGYVGTITDANGCVLVSGSVPIVAMDSVPDASFEFDRTGFVVDFTNLSSSNAQSYLWDFGDGNTSTSMDPTHDYGSNTGDFNVTLIATNDCGSDTIIIAVTSVSIEDDLLAANVNIYPNPTSGTFHVEFGQLNFQDVAVGVYSLDGKVVYTRDLGNTPAYLRHEVHLADNLAKGIYVVRISTRDAVMHERILLK